MGSKLATTIRGLCRRINLRGQDDFDYRRAYARADLGRNYWSVVGPGSRGEYEQLGSVKLKHLIDLGLTPDARVLDVGCGTGLLAATLESYLDEDGRYVGTDLAPKAIEFCRARFRRPNFNFVCNEMTTLPLQKVAFDAIVFFSVFTHTYLDETVLLLGEARRLLAKRGFVFADIFTSSTAERYEGGRSAVIVNEQRLGRLIELTGLKGEEMMTLNGPNGSQRRFWRFTMK